MIALDQSVDDIWREWSETCAPGLTTDFTLAGRADAAALVGEWLTGGPSMHAIRGESPQEAAAFVAAVAHALPDEARTAVLARSVVVDSLEAWRYLLRFPTPLIFIPRFLPNDAPLAAARGHVVLVPVGPTNLATGSLDLGRPSREAVTAALNGMGVPARRAEDIGSLAHRSLLSARNRLSSAPVRERPDWASGGSIRDMVPALFAIRWRDDSVGDRAVLARLGGRPYEQQSPEFQRWSASEEPPLRRSGNAYLLTAPEDAWATAQASMTSTDIELFGRVLLDVLSEVDPARGLQRDERWMAGVRGLQRAQSDVLRHGLAEALILLAMADAVAGRPGHEWVDRFVAELLGRANADDSAQLWASLGDVMPILAEAAPERFLEAVERGLAAEPPIFRELFTDIGDGAGLFGPPADHTGLLFALETLAWAADYFPRVVVVLGRLMSIDPGGRLSNRPSRSLMEVLHPVVPQTSADYPTRLAALDVLVRMGGDAAWNALFALLPESHGIVSMTPRPIHRGWAPDDLVGVPRSETFASIDAVIERLLSEAHGDPKRLAALVPAIDDVPTAARAKVVDAIARAEVGTDLDAETDLWEASRALVARHRQFPDAGWALPDAELVRFEEALVHLQPTDPARRDAWLFKHMPDLPIRRRDDFAAYDRAVADRRQQAVRDVLASRGVDALLDLARRAQSPWDVGLAAATIDHEPEDEARLVTLVRDEGAMRQLGVGFISGSARRRGEVWETSTLERLAGALETVGIARFLGCLERTPRIWDLADARGQAVADTYWRESWAFPLPDGVGVERPARALLAVNRPHLALDFLALHGDRLVEGDVDVVIETLEQAARTPWSPESGARVQGYDVARLMEFLEAAASVTVEQLASLEWTYLPVLAHGDRPAKVLHAELGRAPSFFVTVLTWLFRADGEEPRALSDEDQARARLGYELIESWHRPPGVDADGALDIEALRSWVEAARRGLAERNRTAIGDERIGQILRWVPSGADGRWPAEGVRDLIETLHNDDIERGIEVEVTNSRGVTTRGPTEGGGQERVLAAGYRQDADAMRAQWPRVGVMLDRIAESYEAEGRRNDRDAELRDDTGL